MIQSDVYTAQVNVESDVDDSSEEEGTQYDQFLQVTTRYSFLIKMIVCLI